MVLSFNTLYVEDIFEDTTLLLDCVLFLQNYCLQARMNERHLCLFQVICNDLQERKKGEL